MRIFHLLKKSWKHDSFPFFTQTSGWWHPTSGNWSFKHIGNDPDRGRYHITEVFRNPKVFGFTDQELRRMVAESMGGKPDDPEVIDAYSGILDGKTDAFEPVSKEMIRRGWIHVTSMSDVVQMVGIKDSLKDAVQSAYVRAPQDRQWMIEVEKVDNGFHRLSISNKTQMKRFLAS